MITLTTGLLWQDNDASKPIETVIAEASDAYQAKHSCKPDTCLVYRGQADEPFNVNGILAIPIYPLAHHLLIGKGEHQC